MSRTCRLALHSSCFFSRSTRSKRRRARPVTIKICEIHLVAKRKKNQNNIVIDKNARAASVRLKRRHLIPGDDASEHGCARATSDGLCSTGTNLYAAVDFMESKIASNVSADCTIKAVRILIEKRIVRDTNVSHFGIHSWRVNSDRGNNSLSQYYDIFCADNVIMAAKKLILLVPPKLHRFRFTFCVFPRTQTLHYQRDSKHLISPDRTDVVLKICK